MWLDILYYLVEALVIAAFCLFNWRRGYIHGLNDARYTEAEHAFAKKRGLYLEEARRVLATYTEQEISFAAKHYKTYERAREIMARLKPGVVADSLSANDVYLIESAMGWEKLSRERHEETARVNALLNK